MKRYVFVGFYAVAWDDKGQEYDAPFAVGFPAGSVTQQQVNQVIVEQQQRFKELHPNGRIVQQFQKIFGVQ